MEQKPLSEEYRNAEAFKQVCEQLMSYTSFEDFAQIQFDYKKRAELRDLKKENDRLSERDSD